MQVEGLSVKEFKNMVECCLYRGGGRVKWAERIGGMEKLHSKNKLVNLTEILVTVVAN